MSKLISTRKIERMQEVLRLLKDELNTLQDKYTVYSAMHPEHRSYDGTELIKMIDDVLKEPKQDKPESGIYGNDVVYQAYTDLVEEINRFVPDHPVSGQITGTKKQMQAKAVIISNKAKSLLVATKSIDA